MPERAHDHGRHAEWAGRIIDFLRNFYLSLQTEELRRGFLEFEPELAAFLLSRRDDLATSADWIEELLGNAVKSGNPANLVINIGAAPDLMKALFTMLANKASVGSENRAMAALVPVHRDQLEASRREAMRSLVIQSFSAPVTALEIGTWFGVGSTQLWLASLPPGSSLFLVDSWKSYVTAEDKERGTSVNFRLMDLLSQAALMSTAREIFKSEAADDRNIEIVMMRGKSSRVLDLVRNESFDFIYIDGSHYYADVRKDIARAKALAKRPFAIVCGDDLETLDPAAVATARQHPNRDFIVSDGFGFHPGVTLAVSEEFGRVNMFNGFWWAYQRDGIWQL